MTSKLEIKNPDNLLCSCDCIEHWIPGLFSAQKEKLAKKLTSLNSWKTNRRESYTLNCQLNSSKTRNASFTDEKITFC